MKADDLLFNVRKRAEIVVSDPTDANAGLDLAVAFGALDNSILTNGILPKDWELGKRYIWREAVGGSKVLMFNGIGVGHVMPALSGDPDTAVDWLYSASLNPTHEFPYRIEPMISEGTKTLDEAMAECEAYVLEQTKNVFNPWQVLKEQGLI